MVVFGKNRGFNLREQESDDLGDHSVEMVFGKGMEGQLADTAQQAGSMDDESCLLRSVCELARHPFKDIENNMLTALLTFTLT